MLGMNLHLKVMSYHLLLEKNNVYPNEIENVIAAMPGVREVAVVGVADENSGEAAKAFMVCDSGSVLSMLLLIIFIIGWSCVIVA